MRWNDLIALSLQPTRASARKRSRRYRQRHRNVLRVREALRRRGRAHLYRKGGVYYEKRKIDPVNIMRQRLYQRRLRAERRRNA